MTSSTGNRQETLSQRQEHLHTVVVHWLTQTSEGSVPVPHLPVLDTCLLPLVQAVGREVEDDELVVAIVANLVNTHSVRLQGTFKGTRVLKV